jgi:hypothetical protein
MQGLLPNHGSKLSKISITLEDHRTIHVTAQQLAERDAIRKARSKAKGEMDGAEEELAEADQDLLDGGHDSEPRPLCLHCTTDCATNKLDSIIMLHLDPDLQRSHYEDTPMDNIPVSALSRCSGLREFRQNLQADIVPTLASYLQATGPPQTPSDSGSPDYSQFEHDLEFGTIETIDPDAPVAGPSNAMSPTAFIPSLSEPMLDMTYSPEAAHRVIIESLDAGIAAPQILKGLKPICINGPYAFGLKELPPPKNPSAPADAIQIDNTNAGPALHGPLEPSSLKITEPLAVCASFPVVPSFKFQRLV